MISGELLIASGELYEAEHTYLHQFSTAVY